MNFAIAYGIAADLHVGRKDKAGVPYIGHLVRVAARVHPVEAKIAALFHDAVEDGLTTLEELAARKVPPEVLAAVEAVTRRDGESYPDFIRRAGRHELGRLVKIADLEDNLDPDRIRCPSERDEARSEKYRRALAELKGESCD